MSVSYLSLLCGINKNILIYSICRRYDEMAEKVSDVPDTTEEIVGLQEYLKTVSSVEKKNWIQIMVVLSCWYNLYLDWLGLCILQSSDVTVYKLKDEIEDAASRLMFLLDYAIFPCKDTLDLNSWKCKKCFSRLWIKFYLLQNLYCVLQLRT